MKKLFTLIAMLPLIVSAQNLSSLTRNRATGVEDYANIYTPEQRDAINSQIRYFFDTVQICVVAIPTLSGSDISAEAVALANRWGIGSKANNGLLLLIAVNDHKMFAATGRAIQADITDAQASRLQQDIAVPLFKQSRYYEGTRALIASYINLLSPSAKAYRAAQEIEDKKVAAARIHSLIVYGLPLAVIAIIILMVFLKRAKKRRQEQERIEADAQYALMTSLVSSRSVGNYSRPSTTASSSNTCTTYYDSGGSSTNYSSDSSSSSSSSSSSFDFGGGGGSFDGGGGGSSW